MSILLIFSSTVSDLSEDLKNYFLIILTNLKGCLGQDYYETLRRWLEKSLHTRILIHNPEVYVVRCIIYTFFCSRHGLNCPNFNGTPWNHEEIRYSIFLFVQMGISWWNMYIWLPNYLWEDNGHALEIIRLT